MRHNVNVIKQASSDLNALQYLESEGVQFDINTGVHFRIFRPVAMLT